VKLLITGSAGMVGQNLLEHPDATNYEVLAPRRSELDLLDISNLKSYLAINQPDMIVHAAGVVGGIQANIAEPVKFLVDNMNMGLNILTTAKSAGIKRFLNLSSSCMYPKDAPNPLREDLILKGELEPTNEGYALAKVVSTRLCEYIHAEDEQFLYKTVIPCNLYGRHDKFDPKNSHMIPAVISKLFDAKKSNLKTVDIWGDGQARREFMYAGDLADFVYYAIRNFERMPQNINVGLGHDFSINEYYAEIARIVGFKGQFVHDLTKPVGMKQKLIDDSRMKSFGWKSSTSLESGLMQTFEYFKDTQ
jgi:GDP-L-fucose synthase